MLAQSSGIGNCVNAFASLITYYDIPLAMIVSLRGGPDEVIAAQVPMGSIVGDILQTCGFELCRPASVSEIAERLGAQSSGRLAFLAGGAAWQRLWEAER